MGGGIAAVLIVHQAAEHQLVVFVVAEQHGVLVQAVHRGKVVLVVGEDAAVPVIVLVQVLFQIEVVVRGL